MWNNFKEVREDGAPWSQTAEGGRTPNHYYGDIVRACLIVVSFLLLITVLIDRELIAVYLSIGVLAVLALVVLAGFTSPRQKTVIYIETIVAAVGFVFFEYAAIATFLEYGDYYDQAFLLRQAIAVTLLVALYYGTKSIRGLQR